MANGWKIHDVLGEFLLVYKMSKFSNPCVVRDFSVFGGRKTGQTNFI